MSSRYTYKTQEEDPEFLVQLPKNLLQDLQKAAKETGHTLNTEIIMRLIRTLDNKDIEELENNMLDLLFRE